MLVRAERKPLCEACCEEPSDAAPAASDLFLPHSGPRPKILGVAATLSPRAKLAFVATNLPYFIASACIFATDPVTRARGPFCCAVLCASAAFHGGVVGSLGAVSTYWHGAQCQMQPSCCRWLYCHSESTGTSRLHSVAWLTRLVKVDIGCSALAMGIGVVCFGPARTFEWLALPLAFFVVGAISKARGYYALYALFHGAWHVLGAIAISFIVLDGRLPFDRSANTLSAETGLATWPGDADGEGPMDRNRVK